MKNEKVLSNEELMNICGGYTRSNRKISIPGTMTICYGIFLPTPKFTK